MTISNKLQSFLYDNINLIDNYKFEELFNIVISLIEENDFTIDDLIDMIRIFHSSLGINLSTYIKDVKLQALIKLGYQSQLIKEPSPKLDTRVPEPMSAKKSWEKEKKKERQKEIAQVKQDLRRTIEKSSTEYKDNGKTIDPEYAKLSSTLEGLIDKLNQLSQGYQLGIEVDEFINECQYKKLNVMDAYNWVIKELKDKYDSSFLKKTWFYLIQRLVKYKYKLAEYSQK